MLDENVPNQNQPRPNAPKNAKTLARNGRELQTYITRNTPKNSLENRGIHTSRDMRT